MNRKRLQEILDAAVAAPAEKWDYEIVWDESTQCGCALGHAGYVPPQHGSTFNFSELAVELDLPLRTTERLFKNLDEYEGLPGPECVSSEHVARAIRELLESDLA